MNYPAIEHHGAHRGVTGSCHQLHLDKGASLLIDCGAFQGADAPRDVTHSLGFSIAGIQALVVTHVHIDHIGRIPQLLAAGFAGPILCSEPSAKLLPLMLEDAFRLGISRDAGHVRRFTELVEQRIQAIPFGQWYDACPGSPTPCRVRLQRAGHILGSAYVECDIAPGLAEANTRIVFSGDLGAGDSPLLRKPGPPERADLLVLESTYGDRMHAGRGERQRRLEELIEQALADQGTVLIPAFSLGRTQDLLFELEEILHRRGLDLPGAATPAGEAVDWPQLPIILDAPLASRVTQAYRELDEHWNEEAQARVAQGRDPLGFKQMITIDGHDQHQRVVNYLASTLRPAIVIAGNGMCSSGRILNYLKAMIRHPRHNVIFTGYQAKGTPGAIIQAAEGAEGFVSIDLDGERYEIRAGISTLTGYSAHADQAGLVSFATEVPVLPSHIRLVHGEPQAKAALKRALESAYRTQGVAGVID